MAPSSWVGGGISKVEEFLIGRVRQQGHSPVQEDAAVLGRRLIRRTFTRDREVRNFFGRWGVNSRSAEYRNHDSARGFLLGSRDTKPCSPCRVRHCGEKA